MKKSVLQLTSQVMVYVFLFMLIIFAMFPSLWMFFTSIKPANEVFTTPPKIVADNPTYSNYERVLFQTSIPRAFMNSVYVAVMTTGITLLIAVLAGYGFARFKFKGSGLLSTGLLFGQMLPTVVLVIPLFILFGRFNLIDTRTSLIIANLSASIPIAIIMLKSYIETVPKELEEAAKIDGSSGIGVLIRIIVPVAAPGVTAVSIFSFLNAWEEFLYALNFTQSAAIKTLPIALVEFSGQFQIDWGGLMSAATVISFPVLLIFFFCSKYFVQGLSEGSVKG